MEKKKYYILNLNCEEDFYEIELTDEEMQGIEKYYNIMDLMGIADMISIPLTEEEYQYQVGK